MKTAISVPDPTYQRVERLAKEHGLNRSQFYATAAERFADELESASLTEAINAALAAAGDDRDDAAFAAAASRMLELDEW